MNWYALNPAETVKNIIKPLPLKISGQDWRSRRTCPLPIVAARQRKSLNGFMAWCSATQFDKFKKYKKKY